MGAGALHYAVEDGGVHLPRVQLVQLAVAGGAGEEADSIRCQHVLPGQDVPVGPKAGYLLKTGRQGAQPLGGAARGHVPVLLRGVECVLASHCFHTTADQLLHPGGVSLQKYGVGGQVPAQEDVLRIFQKVLQ